MESTFFIGHQLDRFLGSRDIFPDLRLSDL